MKICKLKDISSQDYKRIMERSSAEFDEIIPQIREIMEEVKEKGDEAVRKWTLKFDKVEIDDFRVSSEEIESAYNKVDDKLIRSIKQAVANVERFHQAQLPKPAMIDIDEGIKVGWMWRPIEKVGIYAPGGRAPYPSSVIMTGVPARVAGCKERILCVPPTSGGDEASKSEGQFAPPAVTLVTADIVSFTAIYRIGGAQAIAAMTYGTETVPKVYKILGPGNNYVVAAKILAFSSGEVAIDSLPGPSEILIIADETGDPRFIAADLISQAEHGFDSSSVLITTSERLAEEVERQVELRKENIATKEAIEHSLESYGMIITTDTLDDFISFANDYASEHLEIMIEDPSSILDKINNAGSIFLGPYSPVAASDYASGSNHVLPTAGYARMFSPLSVGEYLKKTEVQELSKEGLRSISETVKTIAEKEGFLAHRRAVEARFEEEI